MSSRLLQDNPPEMIPQNTDTAEVHATDGSNSGGRLIEWTAFGVAVLYASALLAYLF